MREIARVELVADQRALDAARAVGQAQGLACEQAVVLRSGSNVQVLLSPAPVIARVMTGTIVLHSDPRTWLEREVSVLEFLAPSRLAVTPSPLIAPGPWQHDGLWMTFAQWLADVEPPRPPADPARLGGALRTLHRELEPFAGELGGLSDLRDDIARLHGLLRPSETVDGAHIASLRTRLDAADDVFACTLPVQALHGDASLSNLLHTPDRLVWNDFEDTFRGPVHWDLAGYLMSLRTAGATPAFVRQALDHYGSIHEHELTPFIAAHQIYDEIWRLYDRQRRGAQRAGGEPGAAPDH